MEPVHISVAIDQWLATMTNIPLGEVTTPTGQTIRQTTIFDILNSTQHECP